MADKAVKEYYEGVYAVCKETAVASMQAFALDPTLYNAEIALNDMQV